MTTTLARRKERERVIIMSLILMAVLGSLFFVCAHAAGDTAGTVQTIVKQMISIIGMIFTAVGVILAVYAVGTLILAFKNEDADSKSRASTLLVVAIVLIAFPTIIDKLDLVGRISDIK